MSLCNGEYITLHSEVVFTECRRHTTATRRYKSIEPSQQETIRENALLDGIKGPLLW